ncbi:oxygen-dependent coproporphyrinogen-iii oxidase chloroplastic [Phtheirospermum japonicum]|uniref:Oxygen-dependent coproporphyrinogen-iii oxidase chloroplastic n=1 Tax=Phtheirospermum japonicum TaxID=374723 RepID=A0A830BA93_9LAMI|nr:oxygen-dependent coproporphyrinogen-iii oxidase chloroplastic [Phtheirospermum japonicum]
MIREAQDRSAQQLRQLTEAASSRRMFGPEPAAAAGSAGCCRTAPFGKRLVSMFLLFMELCLQTLLEPPTRLRMEISNSSRFPSSLLASAPSCILRIHLLQLCILITAILRLMPPKMLQEHQDNGGLVEALI